MKRSIQPTLIITFLPTALINIIGNTITITTINIAKYQYSDLGHATLYMKEEDLQCAVAVNLTVLLVLTTM